MPLALLALLLVAPMPSASRTSWMRLESFRLTIGMTRDDAIRAVTLWNPKKGRDANEVVVDYDGDKALTLTFRDDRLRSVRFELFAFLPQVRKAFEEERDYLRTARGAPRQSSKAVLIYNEALPNVIVVLTDDPKTDHGRKGIGVLAVRYFDPR